MVFEPISALTLSLIFNAQVSVPLTDQASIGCIIASGQKLPVIPSLSIRNILPAAPPDGSPPGTVSIWVNVRIADQSASFRFVCVGNPRAMSAEIIDIR